MFESIAPFYVLKQVLPVKHVGETSQYSEPFEASTLDSEAQLDAFDFEGLIGVSLPSGKVLLIDYDTGFILTEWCYAEDFSKNASLVGYRINGWDPNLKKFVVVKPPSKVLNQANADEKGSENPIRMQGIDETGSDASSSHSQANSLDK